MALSSPACKYQNGYKAGGQLLVPASKQHTSSQPDAAHLVRQVLALQKQQQGLRDNPLSECNFQPSQLMRWAEARTVIRKKNVMWADTFEGLPRPIIEKRRQHTPATVRCAAVSAGCGELVARRRAHER